MALPHRKQPSSLLAQQVLLFERGCGGGRGSRIALRCCFFLFSRSGAGFCSRKVIKRALQLRLQRCNLFLAASEPRLDGQCHLRCSFRRGHGGCGVCPARRTAIVPSCYSAPSSLLTQAGGDGSAHRCGPNRA